MMPIRQFMQRLAAKLKPGPARLPAPATAPGNPYQAIRKLNMIGLAIIVLLIGGIGGWAATMQLAGAVIAPGLVVVESNVKKVQHPTGGVVGEILVREGSAVEEGQVVVRLDDTVTRSTLGVVRSQLDEFTAREARLLAERDGAEAIDFSDYLTNRKNEKSVAAAVSGEERLFESRRKTRSGQRSQLRERITQSNEEIRGLSAQQDAKEREVKFISDELVGVTELYGKQLVSISRIMTLQRDKARLEGERGQYIAEIARARGKISETELQILQVDQDFAPNCSRTCARRKAGSPSSRNASPRRKISSSASISGRRNPASCCNWRFTRWAASSAPARPSCRSCRAPICSSSKPRCRRKISIRSLSAPTRPCASWPAISGPCRT